ncbi:uncharacterized protein LOC106877871 [Octopus bimaculoides]|uniref:uncharacterized protein LOC106877871 n=1 Tax=Octopus bimaculoides TaxID=37653 RepID=UPI00071DE08F|nr:uncharacterized protein LOC106877871 [Octopus bimaculoides]|eukprot:XP_014782393.1 PREDICTED: uncharacterized protein LOC106877871 [Octopus bimaculoides]
MVYDSLPERKSDQKTNFLESYSVTRASYAVYENIAKNLKPHSDGEFVKECILILTVVENICSEKLNLFGNINLSRRTFSDRIEDIADDIQNSLKSDSTEFVLYLLAIDETTGLFNTAQNRNIYTCNNCKIQHLKRISCLEFNAWNN